MTKPNNTRWSALLLLLLTACAVTSHPSQPARRGIPSNMAALESNLGQPGPITLETVAAADWQVPLEGLLNLAHPRARHLQDKPEPIQIYFHGLRHPQHGLFI